MTTLQDLRTQRASIWEQMKEVIDRADREGRDLSADDQATYDKAEKDLDRVTAELDRRERHDTRESEFNKVDRSGLVPLDRADIDEQGDQSGKYADAFTSYVRNGLIDMDAEQRGLLAANRVDGKEFRNALGVGTSGAGGYTVPAGFRDVLIQTMKAYGGMLQNATVIHTDSGQTLPWPTVDDTGNVGAILAENTQVSQQDVTFGTNNINAYMYTSKLVLVSYQLLNDSAVNVDTLLPEMLGTRIGRIWNTHFTTGTGSSQPTGIVTNAVTGATGATGQTTSVIYDDLINLIHSLDPAYRTGSPKWMLGDSSLKAIRKLKDSQGHPLWQPSLQAGTADSLLGYPIVINQDMPAMAANAKSVGFGDIAAAYVVRIVNDVQVLRLTERYADFLQVGFFAFARADGTLQNPNAFKVYANSAT